jgi:predicted transcriptional regulator
VPSELAGRVREIAELEDSSVSRVVRRFVVDGLERSRSADDPPGSAT